jgi:hypothetical protein
LGQFSPPGPVSLSLFFRFLPPPRSPPLQHSSLAPGHILAHPSLLHFPPTQPTRPSPIGPPPVLPVATECRRCRRPLRHASAHHPPATFTSTPCPRLAAFTLRHLVLTLDSSPRTGALKTEGNQLQRIISNRNRSGNLPRICNELFRNLRFSWRSYSGCCSSRAGLLGLQIGAPKRPHDNFSPSSLSFPS